MPNRGDQSRRCQPNEPRCEDEPKRRSLPSVAHPKLCALGNMMQGTIACLDARILSSGSQPALKKEKARPLWICMLAEPSRRALRDATQHGNVRNREMLLRHHAAP